MSAGFSWYAVTAAASTSNVAATFTPDDPPDVNGMAGVRVPLWTPPPNGSGSVALRLPEASA